MATRELIVKNAHYPQAEIPKIEGLLRMVLFLTLLL